MGALKKKTRTRIEDIRRVELIDAAYRAFLQGGLTGLTTTRICAEAGLSPGILTYYFKDKNEVLFEMVRLANRHLMNDVVARLRTATTRWERLLAIVYGNFPPDRFDQNTASAWISFNAESVRNPRYQRLQRLFYRRLHSNLASALSPQVCGPALDRFTRGFAAMLDGIWLRRGYSDGDITLEDACSLLIEYAEHILGDDVVAALKAT